MTTNAWGKSTGASGGASSTSVETKVPSFREILDEEVAKEIQEAENKKSGGVGQQKSQKSTNSDQILEPSTSKIVQDFSKIDENLAKIVENSSKFDEKPPKTMDLLDQEIVDCSNDFLLAQYLQMEFDREHDKLLKLEEKKLNGNEKVFISFENYRSTHPYDFEGADSSDFSEDEDMKELRQQKLDSRKAPEFGSSGVIKKSDGGYVTKHDKVVCGRKNTERVLEFPPEFLTGDAVKMDMQLPNHVYNTLKTHMIQEEKRMHKILDKKDKATSDLALDMNTRIVIYKMINSCLLESVTGVIATGKEAIVLHAKGGTSTEEQVAIPAECAIKVYITMLVDFKNRSEYVKEDYRFKNRRKVLKIWAEKELMNLNRMKRAGVRCPSVVKLKKHVLVMSFIGENGVPAPKLKEVELTPEKLQSAYDQIVEAMKIMYKECKLVHGDLSEFNVLYWQDQCYIIDVAQSIDLSHPKSLIFLARDCRNVVQYFSKHDLTTVPSDRQLFNDITGMDFKDDENFYWELKEYVNKNVNMDQRREKRHMNMNTDTKYKKGEIAYDE